MFISWWNEDGLFIPKPVRELTDNDFQLKGFACKPGQECHIAYLVRPDNGDVLYIICKHSEVVIASSDVSEEKYILRRYEVFDDFMFAYMDWKFVSTELTSHPDTTKRVFDGSSAYLMNDTVLRGFLSSRHDLNSFINEVKEWVLPVEYWVSKYKENLGGDDKYGVD